MGEQRVYTFRHEVQNEHVGHKTYHVVEKHKQCQCQYGVTG